MKITHCKLKKKAQKELLSGICEPYCLITPDLTMHYYPILILINYIKQKIMPDSIVYTDSLSSYDKLDVSGFIHHRINHSKEFADRQNHINGIENFWNQAKRVLRKYNGIDRKSFPLFLKECEFRFNLGTPSRQLQTLRD